MGEQFDLAVLVPSRGRPESIKRLIDACAKTCRAETHLYFAFDVDDRELVPNLKATAGAPIRGCSVVSSRDSLSGWTNKLAELTWDGYGALASLGDDHVPLTPGWDVQLLDAIAKLGGTGFAYGDDRVQGENLPTAVVVSSSIVRKLGWFCLPQLKHYCVDNCWKELGRAAGCLAYVPEVVIEHVHPIARGGAKHDQTYQDASLKLAADLHAWESWRASTEFMIAIREIKELAGGAASVTHTTIGRVVAGR